MKCREDGVESLTLTTNNKNLLRPLIRTSPVKSGLDQDGSVSTVDGGTIEYGTETGDPFLVRNKSNMN